MNVISRTLAVGVTGGIGSGKTEVCKIFAALGAKTLSADDIAKEIVASDPGISTRGRGGEAGSGAEAGPTLHLQGDVGTRRR